MCRTRAKLAFSALMLASATVHAQSANMGATFHALEARAVRVTTTFPDAAIDVRRKDGQAIDAVLTDRAGAVRGRLQMPAGARRVQWQRDGRSNDAQEFDLPAQTEVSLDWASHQLYVLWTDDRAQAATGRALDLADESATWDGHMRRDRRALSRGASAGQLAARLQSVETEFDEVVVRSAVDVHDRRPTGKRVDYSRFTAAIRDRRTGAARGFVRWFDTAQVLTWKIEGGSSGVILPERMRGGWTFTPTMGWANVQAYQFATEAARGVAPTGPDPLAQAFRGLFAQPARSVPRALLARTVAGEPLAGTGPSGARSPRADSWRSLPWQFGGRGAATNEEGCDNLHWLDGSIFRVCCDVHDRCYEANGCSSSSWRWPFSGGTWSCARCNVGAVYCFCTLANPAYCGGGAGGGSGGGDGSGGGCSSVAGGFCPAECTSCSAR